MAKIDDVSKNQEIHGLNILGYVINISAQNVLFAAVVLLILVKMAMRAGFRSTLPPGPSGFPVVGVLPFLRHKPYLTIQDWWKTYGDVFSLYMGQRLCIVINGMEMMKECYVQQSDTFSARPWNFFKKLTKNKGLVFTDGEAWREHRRFTLSCMRDFGMGKVCLEDKIHEEALNLLQEMDKFDGKPFDPALMLPKAVSNIISSIIYGSRFDYEDPVFKASVEALDQSVRMQSMLEMIQFIPFLEILPKIMPRNKLLMKNVKMRDDYAAKQLEEHKVTRHPEHPRDYIDAYLNAMYNKQKNREPTTFDEGHLHRSIQDLFIAGTETVNTTLKWSLLFMCVHNDVQSRIQSEIDHVIGRGRFPTMKDRPNMPYTDAAIMECQRLGNIALFSVPRCTTEETRLNGYIIPKGTWVFVNRWGVHMSDKYWSNPCAFDPTRFLQKDNVTYTPEAFVPFGIGPRNCLGASLARMELFLFFTSMLQAFRFRLENPRNPPSLAPRYGINMSPEQYRIVATHR